MYLSRSYKYLMLISYVVGWKEGKVRTTNNNGKPDLQSFENRSVRTPTSSPWQRGESREVIAFRIVSRLQTDDHGHSAMCWESLGVRVGW